MVITATAEIYQNGKHASFPAQINELEQEIGKIRYRVPLFSFSLQYITIL